MGCYLASDDASTIEDVVRSISQLPRVVVLLVASDFNADLADPERNVWDEDITRSLATAGMEDISTHFLPQRNPCWRDGWMWSML